MSTFAYARNVIAARPRGAPREVGAFGDARQRAEGRDPRQQRQRRGKRSDGRGVATCSAGRRFALEAR